MPIAAYFYAKFNSKGMLLLGLGILFSGWIFETYNTYVVSFSIAGVLCIIASVVCFLLPKSFVIKVPATTIAKS